MELVLEEELFCIIRISRRRGPKIAEIDIILLSFPAGERPGCNGDNRGRTRTKTCAWRSEAA